MCLEVGRVDHQRVYLAALVCQFEKHPGEDAFLAPSLPAVVKGLGRAIGGRRVPPSQPIAIDEDYATEDALVVYSGLAVGRWKEGFQTRHLRVSQPEKIAHATARFFRQRITPWLAGQSVSTL